MPVRNIVIIDEEKCTGCGECITSCAEGALEIVDGKAKLVSDVYCDGLGACLGVCPEDAITVEPREAAAFDEEAVVAHQASRKAPAPQPGFVCPGSAARTLAPAGSAAEGAGSELAQWPVQLRLVPTNAPYFQNADLLLVADCVPLAMGDFQARLLKGHAVAVCCPKLDDPQEATEKLAAIFKDSSLRSVTVAHMEVPCCFGLQYIVQQALDASGEDIPVSDVTIGINGTVQE